MSRVVHPSSPNRHSIRPTQSSSALCASTGTGFGKGLTKLVSISPYLDGFHQRVGFLLVDLYPMPVPLDRQWVGGQEALSVFNLEVISGSMHSQHTDHPWIVHSQDVLTESDPSLSCSQSTRFFTFRRGLFARNARRCTGSQDGD